MNLIEQLGGYEKAKVELEILKNSGNFVKPIADDLESNLLEYRRANNIFEDGDKVLFSGSPLIHEVRKLVEDSDDIYILGWGWTYLKYIKHATDEEIAVGYRL
jgi:hypothetical protein